jgi:hypothetical protein
MGIYTNRGFEYLVIPESVEVRKYVIDTYGGTWSFPLNAISIINQDATDGRLVTTRYYKEREKSWFTSSWTTATKLADDSIEDFAVLEEENDIISRISADPKLNDSQHGWHDVNLVYDSYDM